MGWASTSAARLRSWAAHKKKGRPGWAAREEKNKEKRREEWATQKKKKRKETLSRMGCWRELSLRGFNYFQNPFLFPGLNQILNGSEFE
jgi:hypothetical protein